MKWRFHDLRRMYVCVCVCVCVCVYVCMYVCVVCVYVYCDEENDG